MGNKGMTLVELMVAMVIISLALVTMMSMFDLSLATTVKADGETTALFLAQQKMEEVKKSANPHSHQTASPQPFPTPDENYSYEIDVVDKEYNVKEIKVTVHWNSKSVVLITRIGEH